MAASSSSSAALPEVNDGHKRKGKENDPKEPPQKHAKTGGSASSKSKAKQRAAGLKSAAFVRDDSDDDMGAEAQRTGESSGAARRTSFPSDSESSDEE
ncbi:hypothetical protein BDZ89DRAFT_1068280 [Hymenopellis radicata]|nr:hypothetical protein BDZ89DRAFT_1068280 [Hymenopellis radicata]